MGLFGLADVLCRSGHLELEKRLAALVGASQWLAELCGPLLSDANAAMFLVVFAVYLAALPDALGAAAIQELMPNNMRGQTSAIYLLVVNMMGLALGPLILALLTDYLFTEASYGVEGIRYSLLSLTVAAHIISTLLLWRCMGHFRESKDRLELLMEEGVAGAS